jgi:hypothetical protein
VGDGYRLNDKPAEVQLEERGKKAVRTGEDGEVNVCHLREVDETFGAELPQRGGRRELDAG